MNHVMVVFSATGRGILVGVSTPATLAVVYKILDGLYSNMVQAAAKDNDHDGVLFLHHVCRWGITGVLSLSSSQNSRLGSGIELLQSTSNVHVWSSKVCAMTCIYVFRV
jgi:hypothetical protein